MPPAPPKALISGIGPGGGGAVWQPLKKLAVKRQLKRNL
jgi:hypothetical protein